MLKGVSLKVELQRIAWKKALGKVEPQGRLEWDASRMNAF